MAKNPPDERIVYLALKNIFKGQEAQSRTAKTIRKHIQLQQNSAGVRSLIEAHGLESIISTARILLEQEIFASSLKAKIRFPELFEVSPAQSAERTASEVEAAKSEANALKHAAERHKAEVNTSLADARSKQHDPEPEDTGSRKRRSPQASNSVPSLYPVYLPLKSQHQLFIKIQAALEESCYSFGSHHLEDLLQQKGWDSPQCVELNVWAHIFESHESKFDSERIAGLGQPFSVLLKAMAQLRHTAVHRIRVTAKSIESTMADAHQFALLLDDETCAQTLARLKRETSLVIDELSRNKDMLETRLAEQLKEFASKRAEIDRLECEAVKDMLEEDKDYRDLAGANVEGALNVIAEPVTIEASSECASGSDVHTDDNRFDEARLGPVECGTS